MKPRRVIITIKAETDLPLADLRSVQVVEFADRNGSMDLLMRYPADDLGPQPNRIVQVQVNAIRSEPQPRSQRARMAKFAKEDAERADPKRPGWFSDRIAEVQNKPERKAKRAKGAK